MQWWVITAKARADTADGVQYRERVQKTGDVDDPIIRSGDRYSDATMI
jgi:hypothetical protein